MKALIGKALVFIFALACIHYANELKSIPLGVFGFLLFTVPYVVWVDFTPSRQGSGGPDWDNNDVSDPTNLEAISNSMTKGHNLGNIFDD